MLPRLVKTVSQNIRPCQYFSGLGRNIFQVNSKFSTAIEHEGIVSKPIYPNEEDYPELSIEAEYVVPPLSHHCNQTSCLLSHIPFSFHF